MGREQRDNDVDLVKLIGLIYDAISNDVGFYPFLAELGQSMGLGGGFIVLKSRVHTMPTRSWVFNLSASVPDYYSDELTPDNSGSISWQTRPGISEIVVAVSAVELDTVCLFGVQCQKGQEHLFEHELRMLETMLPHIERAIAIYCRLIGYRAPAELSTDRLIETFGLTRCESQIAAQLVAGKCLTEIAQSSGRSRETVKYHLRNLFRKTNTKRQLELVSLLIRYGSIRSPDHE
ncbi:helix-turn-helix transcriptional regulator [Marinobacter sp. AL4B]|uniref:helix-turn-helix transcriptional regulator n=1 Tax=Marinobacter sp. AL4B TaxID=2871173 RepID=UPI001CAA5577|nr:helix-turn-helix transcriptional regulator [Marinobacter sp. AL4B]MBZ0335716.1 helix-turn-helix transcriptional regulator [Marinobacter sp. AL4B]